MRTANQNECQIDAQYRHTNGRLHWLVVRLFRPLINGFAKSVIGRAYERGLLNSFTFHEVAAIIDRSLYPKAEGAAKPSLQVSKS